MAGALSSTGELVDALVSSLTQVEESGGIRTSPYIRLVLFALAKLIRAADILETGYDAGLTTEALALTGARVVGLDNKSEYQETKESGYKRLRSYSNCILVNVDALSYLKSCLNDSFDLIFIDDNHSEDHVRAEAIEVKRLIRSGGIVAFHDVIFHPYIWTIICTVFPEWQKMTLPAIVPWGKREENFGLGVVRRP